MKRQDGPRDHTSPRRGLPATSLVTVALMTLALLFVPSLPVPDSNGGTHAADYVPRSGSAQAGEISDQARRGIALHIIGDEDLIRHAEALGWLGTGADDDPYLVTGHDMTVQEGAAMRIEGTSLALAVTDNRIEGTDRAGIAIEVRDAAHVTIGGNQISGTNTAIWLEGVRDLDVRGNHIENARVGLMVNGAERVTVRANTVQATTTGIQAAADTKGLAISGNEVFDARDAEGFGTGIRALGDRTEVFDNTVWRAGRTGIQVDGDQPRVHGNDVMGGYAGILVSGGDAATLEGNTLANQVGSGIAVRSATDTHVIANEIVEQGRNGIVADGALTPRIEDNDITSAPHAVVLIDTHGGHVHGNRLSDVGQGVDLFRSTETTLDLNLVRAPNTAGFTAFQTSGTVWHNNTIVGGENAAFYLGSGAQDNQVRDNQVIDTRTGVSLQEGTHANQITKNVLRGPMWAGVTVTGASETRIDDNLIDSVTEAVRIDADSVGTHVAGGTIRYSHWGVQMLPHSSDTLVENVFFEANRVGVRAAGTEGDQVRDSRIRFNQVGVMLDGASGITLRGNAVANNQIGLHLAGAADNLVYDNVFANDDEDSDVDVLLENARDNRFNVTRRPGHNIMGGAFVGGNFWGTYTGVDADGDGIGETPHWTAPHDVYVAETTVYADPTGGVFDMLPLVRALPSHIPLGGSGGDGFGEPKAGDHPARPELVGAGA